MPIRSSIDAYKIDHLPKGWQVVKNAATAPNGWVWCCNGESIFTGNYEHALVPEHLIPNNML